MHRMQKRQLAWRCWRPPVASQFCAWVLPVDGDGDGGVGGAGGGGGGTGGGDVSLVGSYVVVRVGGDGAGVIGSIGFGFNDDISSMKFFNRANYKDIELCLAATR